MNRNKELFEDMPVARAVRIMAVPTVISQLIVLIYSLADTFFIGLTNDPYKTAGVSLILPIFNIALSIAGLGGVGGGALISRLLGARREDEAKRVYTFTLVISVLTALLFSLGVLFFMEPLMFSLGAGPDTYRYASSYALCVIVFGGIPTVMSNVLSNHIRSVGESRKAGFGITMGGVINIFLDPLFMFVIMPKGQEILGAGIATCLSNCIATIYFIMVIRKLNNPVLSFGDPRDLPDSSSVKGIFAVGVPSSITTLLFDLDYIVLDKLMSGYGDVALAAVGVVLKAERLPLNVGVGLCQGMLPIIAYNYSSKNYRRMEDTKNFTFTVGMFFAALSIVVYQLFAPEIISIFNRDPGMVELGEKFLRARCLATPFMFGSFFHVYVFNGFGRGKEALFLGIMRWAIINIPMLFVLDHMIGMYGLVWSQLISDVLTVIISVIVYRNYRRSIKMSET